MKNFRLTPLGSMITTVSVSLAAGTAVTIYIAVVVIGGHQNAAGEVVAGALVSLLVALGFGLYWAQLVGRRIRRIDEAAHKVAAGNFATRVPVDSSGQLGQLARTFNEMQLRLAELDNARKQFIANASHELRTPIFGLSGFLELIEEDNPTPADRARFMQTMRQQTDRLAKLTTDLLDLSKLDAGGIEVSSVGFDLGELTREVAREFGPRADQRGSRLELRTPEQPVIALADPERARQIIRILLDNALSHPPAGAAITVTTYSVNNRAEVTVSDDGPGIPQRLQKRLFERFYTADSSGGSGLGLAIARELAALMRGSVVVSSTRRFTAFTLELPLDPRAALAPGRLTRVAS